MKARKVFLLLFIGFLTLTALIAIVSVLIGDFGELQLKILATTFTISSASICAMSCAAFIEKGKSKGLGTLGMACATIAAVMVIAGVWIEIDPEAYWKTTITFIVLGIAFAHAFLLTLPNLDKSHKWIQVASSVNIGILGLQVVGAVWSEIDHGGYYKLLAVVSIIVVFFTLIIPILMKMEKGNESTTEQLILLKNDDGTYSDKNGAAYRVSKIEKQHIEKDA